MKHQGKLIVIEGVDGSGKETQSKLLAEHLEKAGYLVRRESFPRYDQDSSAMVRHYLAGDFGEHPEDVSPYIASTFYAADRYAAYHETMAEHLQRGGVVIADRYTTANMVHQAAKITDDGERQRFLKWLDDYEFGLLELPRPDLVFFLDLEPEISAELRKTRVNKMTGGQKQDIHESDSDFLLQSCRTARAVAEDYGWLRIDCAESGQLRSIEGIHDDIFSKCLEVLNV